MTDLQLDQEERNVPRETRRDKERRRLQGDGAFLASSWRLSISAEENETHHDEEYSDGKKERNVDDLKRRHPSTVLLNDLRRRFLDGWNVQGSLDGLFCRA